MKQLLIVNSGKALNATGATPYDLSGLETGAITFFELGGSSALAAAPTKNFGIALGRAKGPAIVIPEVDIETLSVTETLPSAGVKFQVQFNCPSATKGKEYTLIFMKKGTVPNQRNKFTISVVATSTSASDLATAFKNAIMSKVNNLFDFTATTSTAQLTVQCNNVGEHWNVVAANELANTSLTITKAEREIGGKEFITDLASQCAAGKGFNLLSDEGKEIYPGYPEPVEDLVPNNVSGSSTTGYSVFNLHFATKRDFGKQMDERVWQNVHIAVPVTNASYDTIKSILTGASKYLTKAAADAAYQPVG